MKKQNEHVLECGEDARRLGILKPDGSWCLYSLREHVKHCPACGNARYGHYAAMRDFFDIDDEEGCGRGCLSAR